MKTVERKLKGERSGRKRAGETGGGWTGLVRSAARETPATTRDFGVRRKRQEERKKGRGELVAWEG